MICPKHKVPLNFTPVDGGGQGEYWCPECRRPAQEVFAKLCRETPLPHGDGGESARTAAAVGDWVPTHRHYKGGLYQKLFDAKHSETEEDLTVYRAQDGSNWCRPKAMFDGEAPPSPGAGARALLLRFTPISPQPIGDSARKAAEEIDEAESRMRGMEVYREQRIDEIAAIIAKHFTSPSVAASPAVRWTCRECGYTHDDDGQGPEGRCPKCGITDWSHALLSAAPLPSTPPAADAPALGLSEAMRDVAAERHRQVNVEGWSAAHDDEHDGNEMAIAGACYAMRAHRVGGGSDIPREWPWDSKWWKPKDPRRDLVRAAALIIAEIERLDRLTTPSTKG